MQGKLVTTPDVIDTLESAQNWYVAEILMEITVSGASRNVVHQNLVLLRASTPEEAYTKAAVLGNQGEVSYQNPKGQSVAHKFRGITKLDRTVDDFLEDGAELCFEEHIGISQSEIDRRIPVKESLGAFVRPSPWKERDPDYSSRDILEQVSDMPPESS